MTNLVTHVRLERPFTDSWMTFHLDAPIPSEELEAHLAQVIPGWEWNGCACSFDPDNEAEVPEPWRDETWNDETWPCPAGL